MPSWIAETGAGWHTVFINRQDSAPMPSYDMRARFEKGEGPWRRVQWTGFRFRPASECGRFAGSTTLLREGRVSDERLHKGTSCRLIPGTVYSSANAAPKAGAFPAGQPHRRRLTYWLRSLLGNVGPWGYPLGFIINGLGAATVIVPSAGFATVVLMAQNVNPIWLGAAAGAGGTLGELSGYWLGAHCRVSLEGSKLERFMSRYMGRYGGRHHIRVRPHSRDSHGRRGPGGGLHQVSGRQVSGLSVPWQDTHDRDGPLLRSQSV